MFTTGIFDRVYRIFSYIFVFTIATIFTSDSRQQYRFMHKCNSTLNTLSSTANQTASLPLAMRFCLIYTGKIVLK